MTFQRIEVANFQSLGRLDLELGKFTLITGESNSGKSALMRSLVTVASNMIGTRDIKSGASDMSITITSDTHIVTLHRTAKGGDDYYKITNLDTGDEQEFRTLGVGGVPSEVTEALRISPVSKSVQSINFHIQDDKPYLLTATGSQVARRLGELTRVNEIFKGVQEGTRQIKALNSSLKLRKSDLTDVERRQAEFDDLPIKEAALQRIEDGISRARSIKSKIEILTGSLQALAVAEEILQRPQLRAVDLQGKLALAESVAYNLRMAKLSRDVELSSTATIEAAQAKLEALHREHHEALVRIGQCPTCGSVLSE